MAWSELCGSFGHRQFEHFMGAFWILRIELQILVRLTAQNIRFFSWEILVALIVHLH